MKCAKRGRFAYFALKFALMWVITLDGYAASHGAVDKLKAAGRLPRRVRVRSSKYLNNVIEPDHRRIKQRIRPILGFKRFETTAATIRGIELAEKIKKQQFIQLALDATEIVFARVLAEQKMRIVGALKKKRAIVAVTGDGVNDAPALRKADVGIAMGRSGTELAGEAADMVLLDGNFASIVAAIEEGRAVFANIRNFLTYILTSNVPEPFPHFRCRSRSSKS